MLRQNFNLKIFHSSITLQTSTDIKMLTFTGVNKHF